MAGESAWVLEYQGQVHLISPQGVRVGRGPDNDIVMVDDQISRHHAVFWDEQGVPYVRDEGSMNGTFLNGQRIAAPTPLRPNDRIQIGRATLTIRPKPEAGRAMPHGLHSHSAIWIAAGTALVGMLVLLVGGIALGIQPAPAAPAAFVPSLATPTAERAPILASTTRAQATAVPVATATTQVIASTGNPVNRALMATVLVFSPIENSKLVSSGSGSIVHSTGFILTNYHVVRDEDTGKPFNGQDRIWVYVNSTTDRPPNQHFRAKVVELDGNLDLALLQITATEDGGALPINLALTTMPIGDSDTVNIGDPMRVLGFPGTGGSGFVDDLTITLTDGIISGFLDNRAWIKTAAEISSGNSGGAAINAAGELIGIPTNVRSDRRVGGKIGYIRPVNLAKSVLAKAK